MTKNPGLLSPLRRRDFRILWSSQVFSEFGDAAARVALAGLIYERTGSPALTGLGTVLSIAPWALGPLMVGTLQRFAPRSVMIGANVLRGAIFVLLTIDAPLGVAFAFIVLSGFADPPFEAAQSVVVRESVPDDGEYVQARSLSHLTFQITQLIGFAAAGVLLVLVGAEISLLINAATFAIGAVAAWCVRSGRNVNPRRSSAIDSVREGMRTLRGQPVLWRTAGVALAGLTGAFVAEAVVVGYSVEGPGGDALPLLAVTVPLATIAATFVVTRMATNRPSQLLRLGTRNLALGSSIALIALSVDEGLIASVIAYVGAGIAFGSMGALTAVAGIRVLPENQAATFSLLQSSLRLGDALIVALATALATVAGVRIAIMASMALSVLVCLTSLLRPIPDPTED